MACPDFLVGWIDLTYRGDERIEVVVEFPDGTRLDQSITRDGRTTRTGIVLTDDAFTADGCVRLCPTDDPLADQARR